MMDRKWVSLVVSVLCMFVILGCDIPMIYADEYKEEHEQQSGLSFYEQLEAMSDEQIDKNGWDRILEENNIKYCMKENRLMAVASKSGKISRLVIPKEVKEIDNEAFYMIEFDGEGTIIIHENIEEIGVITFAYSKGLKEIIVDEANSVYCTENGVLLSKNKSTLWAYPNDKNENSYIVSDSIEDISLWAFAGCKNLQEIHFGRNISSIDKKRLTDIQYKVDLFGLCDEITIYIKNNRELLNVLSGEGQQNIIYCETPTGLSGDADNDGQITLADAHMILKSALKIDNFNVNGTKIDVQNVSKCSLEHAQLVLKAALKIISIDELEVLQPMEDKTEAPTGPAVEVPTGGAVEIPTGGAVEVPIDEAIEIPTGEATEVTPDSLEIDYAQIYIEAIDSYCGAAGDKFMALNTASMLGTSDADKAEVVAYFVKQGFEVKEATWDQLVEQGYISYPGTSSANIIGGFIVNVSNIQIEQNRITVRVGKTYGSLNGTVYEIVFEVQNGEWTLVSKRVYARA